MSNSTTAKSRAPSTDASRSAFICFGTGNPEQRIRHRAKFNPKRRQEVENVRKRGACLRCRLLKIPVGAIILCESILPNADFLSAPAGMDLARLV